MTRQFVMCVQQAIKAKQVDGRTALDALGCT